MSFFDRLRPKWKHSDPEIRKDAVSQLTDQALLTNILVSDKDDNVRVAAVRGITDQSFLAEIAKGGPPLNLPALERLSEAKWFIDVARNAEAPNVRAIAIDKIDDANALQRISACDSDPSIRLKAKLKHTGPDRMRDFIRKALSNLHVTEPDSGSTVDFSGNLTDVCGALLSDRRFRINGAVADSTEDFEDFAPAGSATARPRCQPGDAAWSPSQCVELLAGTSGLDTDPARDSTLTVFYQIKIWRSGQDSFRGRLEQRRLEITANAAAWSRSSNSA
jgi:hypothetical protein